MFDTKQKKIIGIIIAAILVFSVVIVSCILYPKYRMKKLMSEVPHVPYQKLYVLKNTNPNDSEKMKELIGNSAFYSQNAKISGMEIVKENDKKGLELSLSYMGAYDLQKAECAQQAEVVLTLCPKLDFVRYKAQDTVQYVFRQYGENVGKSSVIADDKTLSAYVKDGKAFTEFMNTLRPTYTSDSIHETAGKALLDKMQLRYQTGEFGAVGHTVLSAENFNGKVRAYVIVSYGRYRFMNDQFMRVEGKKQMPAMLLFSSNDQGEYLFEHVDFPDSILTYEEAVREMFPKNIADSAIDNKEQFLLQISGQERQQVNDYLAKINRSAEVVPYTDFASDNLYTLGVTKKAYDTIVAEDHLRSYPKRNGTQESIENSIRYVYKTSYTKGSDTVTFTKIDYQTKQQIEIYKVSAESGQEIK